jgi:ApaG protein
MTQDRTKSPLKKLGKKPRAKKLQPASLKTTNQGPKSAPKALGDAMLYETETHGIVVRVEPEYIESRSDPKKSEYVWSYTVEIENGSAVTVRLMTRYWRILDATGHQQEVRGDGVVGEQPTLEPGERYVYTSGCPLRTPSGMMVGSYSMLSESGEIFDIQIPAFSLDSPHEVRLLN